MSRKLTRGDIEDRLISTGIDKEQFNEYINKE